MSKRHKIKYRRRVEILSRTLRAMLHDTWKAGNNSYELHEHEAGYEERHQFINDLLVQHGLAEKTSE